MQEFLTYYCIIGVLVFIGILFWSWRYLYKISLNTLAFGLLLGLAWPAGIAAGLMVIADFLGDKDIVLLRRKR